MYSPLRLSTPSLVFSIMAILLFAIHTPVHAQVQGGADIQADQSDRTLSDARTVEAAAGSQVVIDVFGSGYTGSLGMEATFQLSDPAAVTAVQGATAGIFPLPLPSTIKNNGTVNLTLGAFAAASESGSGLKYIGSLTLTMGSTFSTLDITFIKISFGQALETSPNIVLTVTNPEGPGLPKTVAADLNPQPGNQNRLQARVNPGRAFPLQVFAGNLKKTTGFEIHLESDRDISDPSQIRFQARDPFVVTTGNSGDPSGLPAPMASTTERAGVDIQLGSGDGNYDASALSVAGTPGATVVVEVYGSGYQEKNGFSAIFQVTNPSAIQSLDSTPGAFSLKLSPPKITENIITFDIGSIFPVSDPGGGLKLLGTMSITLSENIGDGLGLTLSSLNFVSAGSADETTPGAVLTVSSGGGAAPGGTPTPAGPSVTIEGRTIIAKATAPGEGVTGNSRLGQFAIFVGSSFRGGELTLSKVIFTSGELSETVESNIVLRLTSAVSDAPVVVRPPVPITVTDSRAIISWETNIVSSGKVLYGTDPGTLNLTAETTGTGRVHRVGLQDLELGTRYFFQVTNTDVQDRTSEAFPPRPSQFVTRRRPDTQLPRALRGPGALGITNQGADIILVTDEAARIDVMYGTDETNLDQTQTRTSTQLKHRIQLRDLTAGTVYFYQVKLTDLNGNEATLLTKRFKTATGADNRAPRILGRPTVIGRSFSSAVIGWLTNDGSDSGVLFGTDESALDDSVSVDESVRRHAISLGNLLTGVTYFYQVWSTDATGNRVQSNTFQFATSSTEDTKAPRFVRLPVVPKRSNNEALIVFEANEPVTVSVQFDTTTAVYDDTTGTVGESVSSSTPTRRQEVRLTNLDAGLTYYYTVSITDLSNNGPTTNPGQLSFATRFVADTQAPVVFSRPVALGLTQNGAIISWGADEPHSAVIRFGAVVAGKQASETTLTEEAEDIEFSRRHAFTLSGLSPGVTYTYEVETSDGDGNSSNTTNLQFTTPTNADNTTPVITRGPVARNITSTSATVDWFTNEVADSRVSWGLTNDYSESLEDASGSRFHSVTITDLDPSTDYHYAVGSADQAGNVVTTNAAGTTIGLSADHTFRTLAFEDDQPPVITEGPLVEFTNQIVIVKWKTDELATSKVTIGVPPGTANVEVGTPVFGQTSQIVSEDNELRTDHSVTVTGLSAGAAYVFLASSTDGAGNTVSSTDPTASPKLQPPGGFGSFTTSTESDTQFPVITSGPTVSASTSASLTVSWDTDESSNSVVNFGASGGAAKQTVSLTGSEIDGTNVTGHQITLTNLTAGTTYDYEVASTDASGNGETRSKTAFGTTAASIDLTAPVISTAPTVVYKTDRSATVSWVTNEASDSEIAFGTSQDSLINVRSLPDLATEHTVTLTNLSASTTYYFQAGSKDQSNNGPAQSAVLNFDTEGTADSQNPTVTDVASIAADSSAVITWRTDEVSDSAVKFGTTSGSLDFNVGDATDVTDHSITLTNLMPSTTYTFIVESIDRSSNGPTQSSEATFTTSAAGEVQAPDPPGELVATGGNGAVKLSWSVSPSSGVSGYVVERAEGEASFTSLASINAVTAYVDDNVQNGTAYRYQVKAIGLQQLTGTASSPSDAVTPTAESGPSTPTLFAIQGTQTAPTLVINNSTPLNPDDQLSYTFHIATSSDFSDAVTIAAGIASGAGLAASDPTGITAWVVDRTLTDGTTYHYRVKGSDGAFDSVFLTGSFTVNSSAPAFPGDFDGDRTVNFSDFLGLINTFNKTTGQDGFNPDADFNNDGSVNFADFVAFIKVFNKKYITGTSGSSKPVTPIAYGIDPAARFQLVRQPSVSAEDGQEIVVDVTVSDVENLKGYGVRLTYDPQSLQFLDVASSEEALLKTEGRLADLFGTLENNPETGEVFIASAVTLGEPVQGQGTLFSLRFRLLDPKPRGELIGIAEGLLIDDRLAINTAQNLGSRLALLPTNYVLEHNFPNPFNPDTTIRYAVPDAGKVTLTVYNVLGQEVTTLVNTHHLAGFYTLQWNGQDRFGRGVASGIYLYHMTAGEFVKTHKMLLLK